MDKELEIMDNEDEEILDGTLGAEDILEIPADDTISNKTVEDFELEDLEDSIDTSWGNDINIKASKDTSAKTVGQTEKNGNQEDFDSLFDNLYNDVVGANDFISNLIEKDSSLNQNEKSLEEIKEKFEQEKSEFDRYAVEQRKLLKKKKAQCDEYVATQRQIIENE